MKLKICSTDDFKLYFYSTVSSNLTFFTEKQRLEAQLNLYSSKIKKLENYYCVANCANLYEYNFVKNNLTIFEALSSNFIISGSKNPQAAMQSWVIMRFLKAVLLSFFFSQNWFRFFLIKIINVKY
jgi:hypothetical protein